jgi:hypothetical protein
MRVTEDSIELCAGREGDDAYVKLTVGKVFTEQRKNKLKEVVEYVGWAFELAEDDREFNNKEIAALPEKWLKVAKTPSTSHGWKAAHSECAKQLEEVLPALRDEGDKNGEARDDSVGEVRSE